jgi:diguanylate cyclase (GGDEF)-like protein
LAVAIAEGGHVFGALTVDFRRPHRFAPDEVDTARALATLLAGANERERVAGEMRHRALHDPLTGLPNRTLFVDRLRHAIARCARHGRGVAVLFLDIDHFKFVNDSLGHTAGDELLRRIAKRLEQAMRAGDTVARFGGDEFLIVCDDVDRREHATSIARRTIEALREPFELLGSEHVVSVSVGITIARHEGRSAEDLIREADAAMYRAKEAGRDGYEVFDDVMRATAVRRLTIESELRAALQHDELKLAYQPYVGLPDGRIRGVEALVRWQHPRQGLLLPGEFIPVAEQTGAILALGDWVLRRAITQAAEWADEHALPVAVNLSARQVAHPGLVESIAEMLAEHRLDPRLLHLEITESALIEPGEIAALRMAALGRLGCSIVLDDFGTGYSSLAYVKRFPIDTLKIDRAFVHDLADESRDSSIVEAIVAMAQGLRVGVVAEGVETLEQARTLHRMGCTLAQGYLFSAPVWPDRIGKMLAGDRLGPSAEALRLAA